MAKNKDINFTLLDPDNVPFGVDINPRSIKITILDTDSKLT